MQVELRTDHNIEGHDALAEQVKGVVEDALSAFSDRITTVEVHLSNQNSEQQDGNDSLRCLIEARLEGRQPITVTDQAATLDQAIDGAADKLARRLQHTLGRRHHPASHRTDPPRLRSRHVL